MVVLLNSESANYIKENLQVCFQLFFQLALSSMESIYVVIRYIKCLSNIAIKLDEKNYKYIQKLSGSFKDVHTEGIKQLVTRNNILKK